MANSKTVWSDEAGGDVRKSPSKSKKGADVVDESKLEILIRRLTSGKGRTVIELRGLPKNQAWCKALAKKLKKSLGVGGTFKDEYIEIHGEKIEDVTQVLEKTGLKWKKTGG